MRGKFRKVGKFGPFLIVALGFVLLAGCNSDPKKSNTLSREVAQELVNQKVRELFKADFVQVGLPLELAIFKNEIDAAQTDNLNFYQQLVKEKILQQVSVLPTANPFHKEEKYLYNLTSQPEAEVDRNYMPPMAFFFLNEIKVQATGVSQDGINAKAEIELQSGPSHMMKTLQAVISGMDAQKPLGSQPDPIYFRVRVAQYFQKNAFGTDPINWSRKVVIPLTKFDDGWRVG